MSRRRFAYRTLALLIITSLLLSSSAPFIHAQDRTPVYLPLIPGGGTAAEAPPSSVSDAASLFRTRVRIQTAAQWRDLEKLDPVILEQGADWALLLVDDAQLETLARWRLNPDRTSALDGLVAANAADNRSVANSLQPLLNQMAAIPNLPETDEVTAASARTALHASLHALNTQQRVFLTAAADPDADGDGLTDTSEEHWCTDPQKADSDQDEVNDYDEVVALKAWLDNETAAPPASGRPFLGWPVNPSSGTCIDGDRDSVPDLAERLDLGLNPDRESTDRDKFDDGQELYGTTNCPGGDSSCGYGDLPRSQDTGYVGEVMPSWVQAPGNHPLVAAFPVPEIDVVEDSLKVETVTTVTTDHVISEGTEKSYSTAKTEGTSTSVANTETWNEWMEVSESLQQRDLVSAASTEDEPKKCGWWQFWKDKSSEECVSAEKYYQAKKLAEEGCKYKAGQGWTAGGEFGFSKVVYGGVSAEYDFGKTEFSSVYTDNRCVASLRQAHQVGSDEFNTAHPLPESEINSQNIYNQSNDRYTSINVDNRQEHVILNNNLDSDNISAGLEGIQFTFAQTGQLISDRLYEIAHIIATPVRERTETTGRSWGGSQTTTNTTYEEHTVTNGEAFSSSESWGTATAVDSAHAADLWFTYQVRNAGMEYARQIKNLAFNLYIGDDPNPACTYFLATGKCGTPGDTVLFENFMPNEEHTFTSTRIPLSLEQMRSIDLGEPIRIVVEDFTYGIDELFYQDAANAGLLIALEDGTDDGDESIDTYLIPTWGTETVLQVLTRYFPHETDDNGAIIAIWTPEYLNYVPSWCQEPRRPNDYPNKAVWCKHTLSTADWWNVYTDGLGDGSQGFQDTQAVPGAVALFRFNQDSDLDGFSDRSEARLGTDPEDASSYPRPELLAGLHSVRSGDRVTSTLSLLNTGIYDAYGVEAVMIAPDDSVSITNNTVGGSGRVRALDQVIVGSRIVQESPLPAPWTQEGHAVPAAGGYYTGAADRVYTFIVECNNPGGCAVGSGSWTLHWQDDSGNYGSLYSFASGYASPTFLPVGDAGLTLALYSGSVGDGDSFSVEGRTPRDTFQYTINSEPYTEPLVVVSYNDPQGNHRFILPTQAMSLTAPTDNLQRFAGQMLPDVGVELVTQTPFAPGNNSVDLLVNNPSDTPLTDAHLFLEFIDPEGTVVLETSQQTTLASGPTYVTMDFNSDDFNPAYDDEQDYIVLAFLTDYEGNIIDTAGRPLSSFQEDPLPRLVVNGETLTWNFGSVPQGTLLTQQLGIANTGYGALYTYVHPLPGLALSKTGGSTIGAADVADYALTLRTADLPVGAYNQTGTIATSDPDQPALTLHIQGTVTANNGDSDVGAIQRPLDVPVDVPGGSGQGEWHEFDYALGPDADSLHPVRVYSEEYATLHGVGKVATSFGEGTASAEMFGDGSDGDLVVAAGETKYTDDVRVSISGTVSAAQKTLPVVETSGFTIGDKVLIHQTRGSGAGNWELAEVAQISEADLLLVSVLHFSYTDGGNNQAQVIRVPEYLNCTIGSNGTLTVHEWNGDTGGVLAVACLNKMEINGSIYLSGKGLPQTDPSAWGVNNPQPGLDTSGDGGGSGSGWAGGRAGGGGGGGGNANQGSNGTDGTRPNHTDNGYGGFGGDPGGSEDLGNMMMGGGGGRGGASFAQCPENRWSNGGYGGNGGGIALLSSRNISLSAGAVAADGQAGNDSESWVPSSGGGGGGAGGSILLRGEQVDVGLDRISAAGGAGGTGKTFCNGLDGGEGGVGSIGRIRIEYCESLTGTTDPPASTQKLDCYITEQTSAGHARLNLPEAVSEARTYRVQFGRKIDFAAAGEQTTTLRIPAALLGSATLDLLLSDAGTGDLTVKLDIGNDGSWDWQDSQSVDGSDQLTSTELAAAFNRYWHANGKPTAGHVDIPVKLSLSRGAQALITNLQVRQSGSRLRSIRLPAQEYDAFSLDVQLGNDGTGPLAVGLDVGDNGTIDWSYAGDAQFPILLNTGDLAGALNGYLNGQSGSVDVPLRFYLSPHTSVRLQGYTANAGIQTELAADTLTIDGAALQVQAAAAGPREGDVLTVEGLVRNTGSAGSQNLTAAFFAHAEGWGNWYIGSAFVQNLPAGGSAPVGVQWDTTGFSGDVPVKMVVNPYGRIGEADYDNNSASQSIYIEPLNAETPTPTSTPGAPTPGTPMPETTPTPTSTPVPETTATETLEPGSTPTITSTPQPSSGNVFLPIAEQ